MSEKVGPERIASRLEDGFRNGGGMAAEFAALVRPDHGCGGGAGAAATTATDAEEHQDTHNDTEKKAWQEADDDREGREFFTLSSLRGCGRYRGL